MRSEGSGGVEEWSDESLFMRCSFSVVGVANTHSFDRDYRTETIDIEYN